jgi:hypothetical protein
VSRLLAVVAETLRGRADLSVVANVATLVTSTSREQHFGIYRELDVDMVAFQSAMPGQPCALGYRDIHAYRHERIGVKAEAETVIK